MLLTKGMDSQSAGNMGFIAGSAGTTKPPVSLIPRSWFIENVNTKDQNRCSFPAVFLNFQINLMHGVF
jgi:hypothetical protein